MEFTEEELQVIYAAISFVAHGNIGFEALEGYTELEDDKLWEIASNLKAKLER